MDSSRSAQRAVAHFLCAEEEHASQIYRKMKEVYGQQCLATCTIFRWCQHYEEGRINIKHLPHPGLPTVQDFRCEYAYAAKSSDHHT
ncbi:hypothetical protein AVEN_155298-1 [Araneus ventricosus]|uniref:Mos1 transposase HTH domain-containing protein n=1 Tax=Araneus ventricosus TaxID=182803 RepID=A0A4Y2D7S7_ARAVE|nr:hypothetical protein AVEN_155298-1 [Araneus ventricosus]